MDWRHWFKILSNLILMEILSSYFQVGVKIVINVCILMVMDSLCFISVWITENSNGLRMKMKFIILRNKSSAGYWKVYQFSNQRRFKDLQKVFSKSIEKCPL